MAADPGPCLLGTFAERPGVLGRGDVVALIVQERNGSVSQLVDALARRAPRGERDDAPDRRVTADEQSRPASHRVADEHDRYAGFTGGQFVERLPGVPGGIGPGAIPSAAAVTHGGQRRSPSGERPGDG